MGEIKSPEVIPLIEISGSPRQRGRQQGEGARNCATKMVDTYRDILPAVRRATWEQSVREALKFLPYGEEAFPQYVQELRGIAEGANLSFSDVWTLNCYEGLVQTQEPWGCTCIAVRDDQTASGHVLLGHNEDWLSRDREHSYLVRATPDDAPTFIGVTYGPLLVNIGLNQAGIGVAINSVFPTDVRVGVPRVLCSRAILAATTIGQAIQACTPLYRAGGYNYLLADENGELYSVETSATTQAITYGDDGWLAHTNHYLAPRMQALEEPGDYAGSHVRLNRARRLLLSQLGQVDVNSIQSLLRDHVNYPDAICSHPDSSDSPARRYQTIASLVMDLTDRVMWAALGPPCEHGYSVHRL